MVSFVAEKTSGVRLENSQLRSQLGFGKSETVIHGLSFAELKDLLTDKGLLTILQEARSELGDPKGIYDLPDEPPGGAVNELCLLGVLYPRSSFEGVRYLLTDQGRAFLNRLEVEGRTKRDEPQG